MNEVEEKSDEELAQEPEQEEVLLGQLSRDHWVISISHIIGAPDLVIEVIIPHTAVYDRTVKREAYALAGIAEYWLIDIIYSTVEVLYLKEKTYRSEGVFKERAFLISNVVPAIAEVSVEQLFAWKPNIVSEL